MFYAKSEPIETITEHTNKLLENLKKLRNIYEIEIINNIQIDKERFWKLLEIICTYHDIGKVFTPFQNIIREKLGLEKISTEFDYESIKHEQLSPLFIPTDKFELTTDEKTLVYQSIFYHHERGNQDIDSNLVQEIIEKDIIPKISEIEKETGIEIKKNPNNFYLKKVGSNKRIKAGDPLYEEYCLLKGLLHRLDHSSSANLQIEDDTNEKICEYTNKFMKEKNYELNDLQIFSEKNKDNNLLVIGSTGMGKTEAALLWSEFSKTFFSLPIRISINAIYDRIKNGMKYGHIGLLHSTALDYLENKQEFENQMGIYEQSKNLCEKITACTIDQIFTFVFKYKGYEKMYSTLSYSKIIIDEIQAYSPEIVAVILKGLQMINNIGGKFMIMTATLPRIYKEELQKMGIKFEYEQFVKQTKRHRIKICNTKINNDIEKIYQNGKKNKVLVITNTINKAMEVYSELKRNRETNVHLLHSRFILKDRNQKEEEIKKFSKEKSENGIWITTQIVEASLDIDFDYLYTEISTLDSLFQRLGRCYRSREYTKDLPNVFIYTEDASGIGYVYDKEINKKSIDLLTEYDNCILEEETKIALVDKLYSKEMLDGTEFYEKFVQGMEVLNNIIDYDTNKKDAQKLLRNIENITIIPKIIYEENIELFERYEETKKAKQYSVANEIKRKINRLTTSINQSQKWKISDSLIKLPYEINNIWIADLKYTSDIGLILERDEEYELDERFCD